MRTLNDSAIFNQLIMKPELLNYMKLINPSSDKISLAEFQNELTVINRRINYGTKGKILEHLNKDNIILVNKKNIKIPKYLSTFGIKKNGKIYIVINISNFINNNGEIYAKTLFALFQNAMISYELSTNWNSFVNNTDLMKNSCISYSRLVTKIFDKIFALDLDKIRSDFISYVFAKFFLLNMCERTNNDTTNALALKACFNRTTENTIFRMEEENEINYSDIFQLFESLKRIESLSSLNIRSFIENYVRMFGESSILSLDYLPSFYHMILSSVISGGLFKDTMIDNVSGKFNNKIYTDIVRSL